MENCSGSVVPIQKGDKFSLKQCPMNELQRKQMENILYASIVESPSLYKTRYQLCCWDVRQISKQPWNGSLKSCQEST